MPGSRVPDSSAGLWLSGAVVDKWVFFFLVWRSTSQLMVLNIACACLRRLLSLKQLYLLVDATGRLQHAQHMDCCACCACKKAEQRVQAVHRIQIQLTCSAEAQLQPVRQPDHARDLSSHMLARRWLAGIWSLLFTLAATAGDAEHRAAKLRVGAERRQLCRPQRLVGLQQRAHSQQRGGPAVLRSSL